MDPDTVKADPVEINAFPWAITATLPESVRELFGLACVTEVFPMDGVLVTNGVDEVPP